MTNQQAFIEEQARTEKANYTKELEQKLSDALLWANAAQAKLEALREALVITSLNWKNGGETDRRFADQLDEVIRSVE